jgi:hypothetical protein
MVFKVEKFKNPTLPSEGCKIFNGLLLLNCANKLIFLFKRFSKFINPKESFRLNISALDINIGSTELTNSWQNKLLPSTKDFKIFVLLVMFTSGKVRFIKEPIWIILKFPFKYLDRSLKFNFDPS